MAERVSRMLFVWGVPVCLQAFACTSTTVAESPPGGKQPAAPLVGPLLNPRAIRGCSWSVKVPTREGSYYLLAEIDDSVVLMNVGGRDIKLARRDSDTAGDLSRVGGTLKRVYESGDVRVDASYTLTSVCPPHSEGGCEVTRFDATLRVQRGSKVETVQGQGEVGC